MSSEPSAPGRDTCVVRDAATGDVASVCAFGRAHVPPHYAPLIGEAAAQQQVTTWWSEEQIGSAVGRGLVVVAEAAGRVVGVAQRGRAGDDHVLYKLYVDPLFRGRGLGPRLVDAVVRRLPPDARRLCVEHFAGNARAGAFYEREGFEVERTEPSGDDPALDVVWRARDLVNP
ncbi:GNAT family N-acetyltransferase [Cellulomonas dongxiuzhuiae]|uniref:GNAT family N-acetyltransferase n=1 Tax=Cellulomonas dongxiuzhuiae TaxID=2819979 RepID=A0ABX8GJN1_9CELL|nr:GNAT family N-acetyltransferase [Cellulomonas dongxiuzhuiae]MBO3089653.1 GNAT family N-acetyltransferase [Cellulomonas dongxiuzhuiae]MBO3095290.1 GNAT family N-acetyltransferase [Cellulomonas dongxiuzhuiae]QWC16284.1 GNAT family N-acetyltransferase [Cellulomonas dongxiuzhuiae]